MFEHSFKSNSKSLHAVIYLRMASRIAKAHNSQHEVLSKNDTLLILTFVKYHHLHILRTVFY